MMDKHNYPDIPPETTDGVLSPVLDDEETGEPATEPPEEAVEEYDYDFVITEKGLNLSAKQKKSMVNGEDLEMRVTRAEAGEGYVEPHLLPTATTVHNPVSEMEIGPSDLLDKRVVRIRLRLLNKHLKDTAFITQVGVYASDPDEGEILYAIVQYRHPQILSSVKANRGGIYMFEETINLTFWNGQAVAIPQSPGWFATQEDIDWIYPTEQIVVIEHGLGRYPRNIELYYARHALGVGGLGERGLGGDNLKSVPTFQVEQMDIYKVGIIVPRNYTRMGSLEARKLSAPDDTILKYSLVPTVSTKKAESLYLMME